MKERMGYSTYVVYMYVVCGILWLLNGLLGYFGNEVLISVFQLVVSLVNIGLIMYLMKRNKEEDDEMTDKYMGIAYKAGFLCIVLLLVVSNLLDTALSGSIMENIKTIKMIAPMIVGIGNIVVGLRFLKLEKDGE